MRENTWSVYRHTFPDGRVYIGITSGNPEKRWANGRGYRHQEKMELAIMKYGWDNIKHEIISDGLTESEAKNKEEQMIRESDMDGMPGNYNTMFSKSNYYVDIVESRVPDRDCQIISANTLYQHDYMLGYSDALLDRFEEKYCTQPAWVKYCEDRIRFCIWRKREDGFAILELETIYPRENMTFKEVREWFEKEDGGERVVSRQFMSMETYLKALA